MKIRLPIGEYMRNKINHRSKKRAKQEKEYLVENRLFLSENPFCQVKVSHICLTTSTQIHHKKGRIGNLLLDKRYWLAICGACHLYIETHPTKAKENGWSLSRLSVD